MKDYMKQFGDCKPVGSTSDCDCDIPKTPMVIIFHTNNFKGNPWELPQIWIKERTYHGIRGTPRDGGRGVLQFPWMESPAGRTGQIPPPRGVHPTDWDKHLLEVGGGKNPKRLLRKKLLICCCLCPDKIQTATP